MYFKSPSLCLIIISSLSCTENKEKADVSYESLRIKLDSIHNLNQLYKSNFDSIQSLSREELNIAIPNGFTNVLKMVCLNNLTPLQNKSKNWLKRK